VVELNEHEILSDAMCRAGRLGGGGGNGNDIVGHP
jgi:hypothetical protein